MYDLEVAKTIIQQLGGASKLKAMIGAKNFSADGNMVCFQFPRCNSFRAVRITLNAMDTYDIQFLGGNDFRVLKEFNGIYNDMLINIFEDTTGLRLSLGTMGRV